MEASLFGEVVLTGKGLTLLNSVPDMPTAKITYRGRIREALTSGSQESLKTTINQLIKNAVEGKFHLPVF